MGCNKEGILGAGKRILTLNALARVAHNPGKAHWDATTKLIRYVSHHRNLGLVYTRPHRDDASAPLCLWSDDATAGRQTTAQSMITTGPLLAGAQQLMTTYYHGLRIVSRR